MLARLPTFIIAGAMRSGTTSLNAYLREHPQVAVSKPKEVHFFDDHFTEGLDWYRSHFPDSDEAVAVGEATPDYMYHREAVGRIVTTLPDVKLIVVLRNPVDRAYSHYQHNVSRGRETLSFEDALTAEAVRIAGDTTQRAVYSYADRGRYAEQAERMLALMDRDRLQFHTFDALEREPKAVFAATCRFLGVADTFSPRNLGTAVNTYVEFRSSGIRDYAKRMPAPVRRIIGRLNQRRARVYEPMRPETRARLADELAVANSGLGELLDIPIPGWL